MLLGLKQDQIEQWSKSLHSYQKGKRTKKPFGKAQPQREENLRTQIENKQMKFNPILQSYRDQRELSKTIQNEEINRMKDQMKYLKNNYRYNVDYDIVNLHPTIAPPKKNRSFSLAIEETRKKEYKDPTYNNFDIINGKQYHRDYLFKKQLKHMRNYKRKILPKSKQSFNIITGSYQGLIKENSNKDKSSINCSLNSSQLRSQFDTITCSYVNPEKQQLYQLGQKQKYKNFNFDREQNLPPSYRNRQKLCINLQAPVQQINKQLDKQKLTNQRYKKRHLIEAQYKMRNIYQNQKKDQLAKYRVHNGRMLESKARQFNILNAENYEKNRTEMLFGKEIESEIYDLKPYAKKINNPIRQSGFNTIDIQL